MEVDTMTLEELLVVLSKQNRAKKGFQVHLNSGCLEAKTQPLTSIEFNDLYFSKCELLGRTLLAFSNADRKPTGQSENGTQVYPCEVNSSIYIDLAKIEDIEDVQDFTDWFEFPSERVINLYMFPEDDYLDGDRNVVSIGFMN